MSNSHFMIFGSDSVLYIYIHVIWMLDSVVFLMFNIFVSDVDVLLRASPLTCDIDFYIYMCVFVKRNGLPKQDTALYKNKFILYCIVSLHI